MRIDVRSLAGDLRACASALAQGAWLGAALLAAFYPAIVQPGNLARVTGDVRTLAPAPSRVADFGATRPSADARDVADWVARVGDNGATPFVLVDKKAATLYVFDRHARLLGASPVLLGAALGDASVPGIGERPIALVHADERTTPAGRFIAERGHNARGDDVVWVDYDAAVSMHRVITSDAAERRLARLASAAVEDNRISYGCINVPVAFYEAFVRPAFANGSGVVYVLPDRATIHQVFGV